MTSAISSERAWSSATSCSTCASASAWRRPFSTIPARRSAIARQLRDVAVGEVAVGLGLDVEDADDLVVPGERHGQHRVDEPALVDAPDPQEAGSSATSAMTIAWRIAATRPVIPSPNGTMARPIWWRSSPFVPRAGG